MYGQPIDLNENYNLLLMSILSNTKKSGTIDRKNSAKLPKLTIQQQIDNNEVIERMNRKITFTKNARHLSKTLQYVQAFQNTNNGSVFRVDPMELYFTNFEANKIYESEVKLVNRSKHIQRIKITPLQKKEFVVSNVKYPIEDSGDIAPGMQVSIFVRFKPTNLHDNEDELIVIVGDGVVRISIKAQREKCKGQWPTQINCGHCWVGDQQLKEIFIPNKGGEAIYRIQDSGDEKQRVVGLFRVWPTELKLEKSNKNSLFVNFSPNQQGKFEEKITFISNQGEEERITIKLVGGAYSAQITLDEINNQRVAVKKFHNHLYLNNCEPGKESSANFKIHNHAVVPVDYLWHYESQPNFSISQQRGKIAPAQVLNFVVSYRPATRNPLSIFAYLYLYNLPKESILNNSASKMINGIEMIQCIKLEVKVTSSDSSMEIVPLHKKIPHKLYQNRPKRTSFTIENNSKVERKYRVEKIKQDKYCKSICEIEGEKTLRAGETEEIWFEFMISELTSEKQTCYYLVHFDNLAAKMISIEGKVQFPDLHLYTTNIDFELMRVNSIYRKKFKLVNMGENIVQFKFVNPHRYYQLDFYDFYEFEDDQFYQDKLRILTNGIECTEWTTIQPESQLVLQFQFNTKNEEETNLDLKLVVKDGGQYQLKVIGDVQEACGKISQTYIPLKQIFQGNLYNSNKFLPRELSVDNPGNVKVNYQIVPSPVQQCLITISQLKGTIQPKSKKRIDLILEPLKTGPFSPSFKINFYDNIPLYDSTYLTDDSAIEIVPQNRKELIATDEMKIEGKIRGVETSYYIKDESRAKKVVQKMVDDGHASVKLSNHSYKSGSASKSIYLESYKIVYPALQQLNFYNCEINKVQQQEIIIENNSELTTQFEIFAEHFRSIEKVQSQTKSQGKGMMQSQQLAFTSMMGKTYIENRALNQAQKIYLSNNKGISIMCQPNVGVLHKRQTQKIVVTMFNDASGRFKDNLVISIKDHEVKKFPINIQIKGTPVSLSRNQLGINFNHEVPLLHAGTFFIKNGKSTRNIKIINNGPKEVEIKWVIYPYGSASSNSDIFNISFAGAQPGTNNIVETNWQALKPEPLKKSPFSITPSEKVLKGRQQANFLLAVEESNEEQTIKTLIIGEPIMLEEGGRVSMEQLAMVVEAEMVKPVLKIDQKHQNHINKFERFAVVGNEHRTKANDFHRKIKLKNHQRCNISFTVQVRTTSKSRQCFEIVSTSTDSPLSKLKQKTLTPSNTLAKTSNLVQISKQFILPYESYAEIGIDLLGNPKDVQDWPLQPKVRRDGQLVVNFSSGQKQIIPLVGWLYRPYLNIQMPNQQAHSTQNLLIDFGVIHVNNHKKKSIYLANPTKSAADWSISYVKYEQSKKIIFQKQLWTDLDYEDQKITDQKKCFRLSQDSGHLLAESIPIHYIPSTLALNNVDDKYAETHKPFKLDFLFKPQTNVLYKSKFIIKVEHGPSYEIIVRGRGTFQEEAQVK